MRYLSKSLYKYRASQIQATQTTLTHMNKLTFLPHSVLHLPIPTCHLSCSYTSICGTAFSAVIYKPELLFLTYDIKRINKNLKKNCRIYFFIMTSLTNLSPCSVTCTIIISGTHFLRMWLHLCPCFHRALQLVLKMIIEWSEMWVCWCYQNA